MDDLTRHASPRAMNSGYSACFPTPRVAGNHRPDRFTLAPLNEQLDRFS